MAKTIPEITNASLLSADDDVHGIIVVAIHKDGMVEMGTMMRPMVTPVASAKVHAVHSCFDQVLTQLSNGKRVDGEVELDKDGNQVGGGLTTDLPS